MQDGFTIRKVPEQQYKICNGCTYLNTSAMFRGHKSHTNNFTCTHPEFKGELGLMSNQPGRTIHFDHKGDCTTPTWCPFLNPKPQPMTDKSTVVVEDLKNEGNKLIAEFMGVTMTYKFEENNFQKGNKLLDININKVEPFIYLQGVFRHVNKNDNKDDILKAALKKCWDEVSFKSQYHSSWDWLMPVVQKIRDLKISEFPQKQRVINALVSVEITELWQSVVGFIKWHNQYINQKANT